MSCPPPCWLSNSSPAPPSPPGRRLPGPDRRSAWQPLGFVQRAHGQRPGQTSASAICGQKGLQRTRQCAQGAIKTVVFAGHTDVVPTGPLAQWGSDPFTPTQRDGKLYGRGASDMKTSIAAFVVAVEEFLAAHPNAPAGHRLAADQRRGRPGRRWHRGGLRRLLARGERLDYCIVGEPTSVKRTGDMIKNGRRGTISGKLTVQGHSGPHCLPAPGAQPHPPGGARAGRTGAIEWDAATPSSRPPAGR
jgi:succinyl-diaminopimelate desuccinylase